MDIAEAVGDETIRSIPGVCCLGEMTRLLGQLAGLALGPTQMRRLTQENASALGHMTTSTKRAGSTLNQLVLFLACQDHPFPTTSHHAFKRVWHINHREPSLHSLAQARRQLTYTLWLPESNHRRRRDAGRRIPTRPGWLTNQPSMAVNPHDRNVSPDRWRSSIGRHGKEQRQSPLVIGQR